ncbi:hypothetical protein [Novosphingobium silvae]|uniref:hypothetical protein n=1 Tax=Novosphingobium silvae TaxID=2692619 RepID=UPI00301E2C15
MPYDIPSRFQQPPAGLSQADRSPVYSSNVAPRLAAGTPIEIIVGLPGLSEGPLLARARVAASRPHLREQPVTLAAM